MDFKQYQQQKLRRHRITGRWYDGTTIYGWPDVVFTWIVMCMFTTLGFLLDGLLLHDVPTFITIIVGGCIGMVAYIALILRVGFWRTTVWMAFTTSFIWLVSYTPIVWWGFGVYAAAIALYSGIVVHYLRRKITEGSHYE